MKKIYSLLAMGIMIAGLTGCGSASSGSTLTQEQPSAAVSDDSSAALGTPEDRTDHAASGYSTNSIVVNSSEKVTVIPDIAEVVYSVRTEDKNAAACQQKNTEAVSQVIELLKSLNIAEASIQTSDYYMNPVYNYSGNTARITGYEATTTLTVSDLAIDGLDEILSQSISSGINTIQSITYQASKYDESYQAALTAAVETAYQKAKVLAEAAGCNVGTVINIQETSGYSEARYSDLALTNKYRSTAGKEAVYDLAEDSGMIMPGEIQVEASITAEYRLY